MPPASESVIGHIVDVQGGLLTATLDGDEQGASPIVTIAGEDILVGQIGSYVAIKQGDIMLIAIVTRMTEQEALLGAAIETPTGEEARLPFAKRMARLMPLGSIAGDGQFTRGVGRYPTTGAEVHAIGTADIAKMFERYQSKGFSVGTVATHPSLRVCLDPSNLFGRHFAILGQTGAGKSWTVSVQRFKPATPWGRASGWRRSCPKHQHGNRCTPDRTMSTERGTHYNPASVFGVPLEHSIRAGWQRPLA